MGGGRKVGMGGNFQLGHGVVFMLRNHGLTIQDLVVVGGVNCHLIIANRLTLLRRF